MKYIQDLIERLRSKARKQRSKEMCADFVVAERNGRFWITHMGVAIAEISPLENARNMAERLHDLRQTALNYENLNDKQQ